MANDASDSEDEEIWDLLAGSADTDQSVGEANAIEAAAAATEMQREHVKTGGLVKAPPSEAEVDNTMPLKNEGRESATASARAAAAAGGDSTCCNLHTLQCCSSAGAAAPDSADTSGRSGKFSGKTAAAKGQRIPIEILEDTELNAAIAARLPKSYNFEIHKTVWRLRKSGARHVGLQMPEGLQQWALDLADVITCFVPSVESTTIMGDVTFGACCIDDLGARAVGVDFIVHYGHSCLVPTDQTTVSTLYVHVEVEIDVDHLVETVRLNFQPDKCVAFMGSVQFAPGTMRAVEVLRDEFFADGKAATVPQVKPLSIGETLGCTSPVIDADVDAVVFVCDGRFHLESAMIQNPGVKGGFYRYDPFYRTLTRESFAHEEMHRQRRASISAARSAKLVGLVLSTLGRQGSPGVLEGVEKLLVERGVPYLTVLLSDVSPDRLARFNGVEAWVQVACPRLSIDWGEAFGAPLLTPYEAHVAFGGAAYSDIYPMDYYSNRGGPWSNYRAENGHGGSLETKFRNLGRRRLLEYEDNKDSKDNN